MNERYARQMALPEVGRDGQEKLASTSVLVVGAGGLGCAVLQYLAGAGVGQLVIVDHDRVEETNLHRQPLYRMSDIGRAKAEAARMALLASNPDISIGAVTQRLTPANAARWVKQSDIVVDAADSLAVTYTLNDACLSAGQPFVSASVLGLAGYAGVFCGGVPSYRAVFPEPPAQAGSCAADGVLGTAVGVMGTLQAHLILALALDHQPSPRGQLVSIDFRTLRFSTFSFASACEPGGAMPRFVAASEVVATDLVVDLRSREEAPQSPFESALRLGVEEIDQLAGMQASQRVVLCCRSGLRAWRAANRLLAKGHTQLALLALEA